VRKLAKAACERLLQPCMCTPRRRGTAAGPPRPTTACSSAWNSASRNSSSPPSQPASCGPHGARRARGAGQGGRPCGRRSRGPTAAPPSTCHSVWPLAGSRHALRPCLHVHVPVRSCAVGPSGARHGGWGQAEPAPQDGTRDAAGQGQGRGGSRCETRGWARGRERPGLQALSPPDPTLTVPAGVPPRLLRPRTAQNAAAAPPRRARARPRSGPGSRARRPWPARTGCRADAAAAACPARAARARPPGWGPAGTQGQGLSLR
jgi:hypothetical protein